jgi:hydrogenase expression/formation protein HypC
MCLAVPSKIVSIGENDIAQIDVMGVQRDCSIKLTPDAKPGDYVLVHAGFAIQIIEEQDATETLRLLNEMEMLEDESMCGAGVSPEQQK